MKHKHHIIPKHAGGTDEPDNLIDLTIEEHAEAHKKLFEEFGRWQDELAWKGLSGTIGKEEIITRLQLEGVKKGGQIVGSIQGKINVETGHIFKIATQESRSLGGKKITEDKEKWKEIASLGGIAASKINIASGQVKYLSRKVISENDGKVISWNNKHHYEKKTGYRHTWKNYEESV
jgi:hypothetical protein